MEEQQEHDDGEQVIEEEIIEEHVIVEDEPDGDHQQHGTDSASATTMVLDDHGRPRRAPQLPTAAAASGHVYAIRGGQIYKIDKQTGQATPIRATTTTSGAAPMKLQVVGSKSTPTGGTSDKHHIYVRGGQDTKANVFRAVTTSGGTMAQPVTFRSVQSESTFTSAAPSTTPMATYVPPRPATKKKQQQHPVLGHRKPCNCNKSLCLKLYCDCFANGEFCRDCNCKDCHNNMEYDNERSKAIKSSLERNPHAFKPKIDWLRPNQNQMFTGKGRSEIERLHQKGCHCKKSNCLKNYCECYEAKVPCTDRCKCCSCRNTESDRQNKLREKFSSASGLLHLATAAAEMRSSSPFSDDDSDNGDLPSDPKTLPWFYMTDEVVEATTLCLVAQAEEQETGGKLDELDIERAILREFGRCLQQIIENAAQNSHQ